MPIVLSFIYFFLNSGMALGAESQFGFVYTTDLLPKQQKEIEQWITWRTQKVPGGVFDLLEGRTAIEYGLSDDFQVALYATYDWTEAYHNGPGNLTTPPEPTVYDQPGPDDFYKATRFVGVSFEAIYRVLSPYVDPVGMAVYVEPTFGSAFTEVETKLIFQKNFLDDTLTLGFNFTYAPEYRLVQADADSGKTGAIWNEETDINFNLGVSYRFIPNWSLGFEFINEHEYNSYDFSNLSNSGFYLGPSVHYGGKDFFVTGVFVTQLPWAVTHSATVPGAIVNGYDFDNDFEKYRLRIKFGFYL